MKRLLFIILTALCLASCGVSRRAFNPDVFKIGRTTIIKDYRVFHTLDNMHGLAMNPHNGMVVVIRTNRKYFPVYDGREIRGSVMMVDIFTYDSVLDDGRHVTRTVPIVTPMADFRKSSRTGD